MAARPTATATITTARTSATSGGRNATAKSPSRASTRSKPARGNAPTAKVDPYDRVLAQILAAMDSGEIPWRKPWFGTPTSLSTGHAYQGTNRLVLSMAPYTCPTWGTFNQIKKAGGSVKPGEHGSQVIFPVTIVKSAKPGASPTDDPANDKEPRTLRVIKVFTVFNLEQTDLPWEVPTHSFAPIEAAVAIAAGMPAPPQIEHAGFQAFYMPASDRISLPGQAQFSNSEGYYATLFHELGHSTGHTKRLARPGVVGFDHFGSGRYAAEELVAEITAAFLCGEAGIAPATVTNSAAYIQSWSKALRADPKILVRAASEAQKAADHVLGRAPRVFEPAAPQAERVVTAIPTRPAPVPAAPVPATPVSMPASQVGAYTNCQRCGKPLTGDLSVRRRGYGNDCWDSKTHGPRRP